MKYLICFLFLFICSCSFNDNSIAQDENTYKIQTIRIPGVRTVSIYSTCLEVDTNKSFIFIVSFHVEGVSTVQALDINDL